MSKAELLRAAATSYTMYSKYERAGSEPELPRLQRFRVALDTTLDYLAPETAARLKEMTGRTVDVAGYRGEPTPVLERGLAKLQSLSGESQNLPKYRSSHPQGDEMRDEELRYLFSCETTSRLTQDQRLGLLLLIDGTGVDESRVRHALELLFPPVAPTPKRGQRSAKR